MKFLDINGLGHFLDKVKTWTGDNYYAKQNNISIDDIGINMFSDIGNVSIYGDSIQILNRSHDIVSIDSNNISLRNSSNDTDTNICSRYITSPKFIKTYGTSSQVLLANGDIATLDAANGIPTLNADGKLDASKVDIDTTLFEVVTELPSTNATIIKNRIYLKASAEQDADGKNIYAEYVYTGDLSTDYDESKWEKLGEYKSDVDLSGYAKKSDVVTNLNLMITSYDSSIHIILAYAKGDTTKSAETYIAAATTSKAGVMSKTDKIKLDAIAESATADEALTNDDIDTLFTA